MSSPWCAVNSDRYFVDFPETAANAHLVQLTVFVSFACLCVLIQGQDTMALRYLFQIAIKQEQMCAKGCKGVNEIILQFLYKSIGC